MLPEAVDNSGDLAKATRFDVPVPITGMAGDQQAALFGQQCVRPGMVKNTYGTGCFMLMNTGSKAVPSKHALLTTVAWQLNGQTTYALEGSVFIGGAAVQWLRDELNFIEASPEIEALALAVDSSDGVVVVPAFAGLGAPHWNPHARGSILGMTRGTNRSHIARATLESIAFQSMDLLDCMQKDSQVSITEVRVDGGASENALLMQIQSDALGIRVIRPANGESTAMGAAYFAGLGAGVWKDMNELSTCWTKRDGFDPAADRADMQHRIVSWHRAVRAVLNWSNDTAAQ
jgi:glycerol kinase